MNCDCIKDIEGRMAKHMRPQAGDDCTAKVQGTALCLSDDMGSAYYALQIPFRIKGSKKGYTSERGKEIGCNTNYCPFCGRTAGAYTVGEYEGLAPLNLETK